MPIATTTLKESGDLCALPRCRTESSIEIWLQRKRGPKKFGMCDRHWEMYCDPDTENRIRKQLKVLPRTRKETEDVVPDPGIETKPERISNLSDNANTNGVCLPSIQSGSKDDAVDAGSRECDTERSESEGPSVDDLRIRRVDPSRR